MNALFIVGVLKCSEGAQWDDVSYDMENTCNEIFHRLEKGMRCVSKELTRVSEKGKQESYIEQLDSDHLEASVNWMTEQNPKMFEELSAECITHILPASLWNSQTWLTQESVSQLLKQCRIHRMYVYQFKPLLHTKHV